MYISVQCLCLSVSVCRFLSNLYYSDILLLVIRGEIVCTFKAVGTGEAIHICIRSDFVPICLQALELTRFEFYEGPISVITQKYQK